MVRIGVVDNDVFALNAMAGYLRRVLPRGYVVVWLADSGRTAVDRCLRSSPVDVLLVDMSMGGMDGLSVIRAVRERDSRTVMIAVTSFSLDEYAADAAKVGAQAIVGKADLKGLVDALVHAKDPPGTYGDVVFASPEDAFERLGSHVVSGMAALSDREREIVAWCSRGDTSADIAGRLGLSEATVNTYLKRAIAKAGARNRVHLVSMWLCDRPAH